MRARRSVYVCVGWGPSGTCVRGGVGAASSLISYSDLVNVLKFIIRGCVRRDIERIRNHKYRFGHANPRPAAHRLPKGRPREPRRAKSAHRAAATLHVTPFHSIRSGRTNSRRTDRQTGKCNKYENMCSSTHETKKHSRSLSSARRRPRNAMDGRLHLRARCSSRHRRLYVANASARHSLLFPFTINFATKKGKNCNCKWNYILQFLIHHPPAAVSPAAPGRIAPSQLLHWPDHL